MRASLLHGTLAGPTALPYTLSSQSSIITSLGISGRRANSRMAYLSSQAGCVHDDKQPAAVSFYLEVLSSVM